MQRRHLTPYRVHKTLGVTPGTVYGLLANGSLGRETNRVLSCLRVLIPKILR